MRYIIKNTEIRYENAAKPHTQKSKPVNDYLETISGRPSILDYGCGKLRYSDTLVKVASEVTFVDSEIQIGREQVIRGEITSVRKYVKKNYAGCKTVAAEKLETHKKRYDIVTCTNVLSAIPCDIALEDALRRIRELLKENGYAFFVNQHRSSYFKKYTLGKKWLYGYLYSGKRCDSYYGILDRERIECLLKENYYSIRRTWVIGESTFTEAHADC
ncbi:class I SAM-dependent methyltransferase [Sessilibacter sp. MAH1]